MGRILTFAARCEQSICSELDIAYCDDALLAVNKPHGLLSVPGRGAARSDCLATRVQSEFPDALHVHRLDMHTSGLQLFARSKDMLRQLSRMFREREIGKSYIALVSHSVSPDAGEINLPLIVDWPARPRQMVDFKYGKPSLTRYRLLQRLERPVHSLANEVDTDYTFSRVQLEPVTGRTHQLRVHMASIGHPILGDTLYGGTGMLCYDRMMLHAQRLYFVHPVSNQWLDLTSKPPF